MWGKGIGPIQGIIEPLVCVGGWVGGGGCCCCFELEGI